MIDISKYIQALRKHDFITFAGLISDIADEYSTETGEPIGADKLQDYLLYFFIISDFSEEKDWFSLALLYHLTFEIRQFQTGDICYNSTQLVGAMLTALTVRLMKISFSPLLSTLSEIEQEVTRHRNEIARATELYTGWFSFNLDAFEAESALRPYFTKQAFEEAIAEHYDEQSTLANILSETIARHDRVTPYLALYLLETKKSLSKKYPKSERDFFDKVMSSDMIKSLEAISQTRELFTECSANGDYLADVKQMLEGLKKTKPSICTKVFFDSKTQSLRFFLPARTLVEAEQCLQKSFAGLN